MWLVEVIPASHSIVRNNSLTYFTTQELLPGTLVRISFKNQFVPAFVLKTEKLTDKKANIKKQSFSLKKIDKIISPPFISPAFYELIEELSRYFLTPAPLLFSFFLPKVILEKRMTTAFPTTPQKSSYFQKKVSCFQGDSTERIKHYKGIIRESFAQGHSTFILLPTQALAEKVFLEVRQGLENRSFLLHSNLTPTLLLKNWHHILADPRSLVVVGTHIILSAIRADTAILVVEREASEHYYHSRRRPFIDIRKAAEIIARKIGLHLIWGDMILRLEVEDPHLLLREHSRILSPAENKIIDGTYRSSFDEFQTLSEELILHLKHIFNREESVVLITHRRGHTPSTLCRDCGELLTCSQCSSPLVIHIEKTLSGQAQFLCHHCLKKEEIVERCPKCKSWRLASYGVGIERIGEEFKRHFPMIPLFRFDRDVVKTKKEALRIKEEFLSHSRSALIATELFLNFFHESVAHIAIVTVDGLLSIPDYRMHERVMNILLRLRALSQKSFVIQTRFAKHPVFSHAVSGNITRFKETELQERKLLAYPPAVDMIRITIENTNREALLKEVSRITTFLAHWNPIDFPAFIEKIKRKFRWHILIRLERGSWPEKHPELENALKKLPPSWNIHVDPPSLL